MQLIGQLNGGVRRKGLDLMFVEQRALAVPLFSEQLRHNKWTRPPRGINNILLFHQKTAWGGRRPERFYPPLWLISKKWNVLNKGTQSQDIFFVKYTYLRCQSSLPQSEGTRHHRGPRRRGPLQRYRTGRTRCYFQSPPSRYAARSSPGWTGRGSASALQEQTTNTTTVTKTAPTFTRNYLKLFFVLAAYFHCAFSVVRM